jgi:hypothetical protein
MPSEARSCNLRTVRENDIALVSANFASIDEIKVLPRDEAIDAFHYTDEATRARSQPAALSTWSRVLVPDYPRHDFSSRLRSRYFKHQIHRLDEVRPARWLVWADSSLQFKDTRFILDQVERLRQLSPRKRVLLVPHPNRTTIRQEYEFISTEIERGNEYLRVRYGLEKMTEQMEHFRSRGWSDAAPLFCGGFWIVENSELMNRCWDAWWDQNLRFGMMDQLSLSVVLEDLGCVPQRFEVDIFENPHFSFVAHAREG